MIKAIIEAVSKNGLHCGLDTNFSPSQLKFVLEDGLNKFTVTKFQVADDGTITLIPASGNIPNAKDLSEQVQEQQDAKSGVGDIPIKKTTQKATESGMIIKNCLRDISVDEIQKVRNWIADFERRTA